jgi:hypothetical protein
MSPHTDAATDPCGTLEAEVRAAERDASAALVALSERIFIRPAMHDGLRGSESFRHWRACSDRARQLRERLDARTDRR